MPVGVIFKDKIKIFNLTCSIRKILLKIVSKVKVLILQKNVLYTILLIHS